MADVSKVVAVCSEQILRAKGLYGNISNKETAAGLAARIYGLATLSLLLSWWYRGLPFLATVTAGGGMGDVVSGRGRRVSYGLRDELPRGKRFMVRMESVG